LCGSISFVVLLFDQNKINVNENIYNDIVYLKISKWKFRTYIAICGRCIKKTIHTYINLILNNIEVNKIMESFQANFRSSFLFFFCTIIGLHGHFPNETNLKNNILSFQ